MKKLFLLVFLAVGMTAHAESFVVNANHEAASTDATNDVKDEDEDEDDPWSFHVNVGVDVPTGAPDGVKFAPFRSWEIGITVWQYDYAPNNGNTTLSAGLGVNWRNYTLSGHKDGFFKENGIINVHPVYENWQDASSSIHTTAFTLPLLVKQRFSKNFAVSLGAQLNWNFYSRVNNEYEIGDDDFDVNTKKIGERPITVDILGIIHIKKVGIYCKYSPMSVLKSGRGPEFKSLAFGIYL